MQKIKNLYKSFILMFSEIIWIYYTIVMFTSVKWNEAAFFDLTWFVVAAIIGYGLNVLLIKRSNHKLLFLGNVLAMGFMVIQNWRNIVPEGTWGFGIGVSIGLSLIFLRSARLAQRQPTRLEMLRRFEGNVIYYIVFAVVFTVNQWSNNEFHFLFVFAIFNSLIGMMLTLENLQDVEGNQNTKTIKVGQSSWFAAVVTLLLICIPLFSLILLLPSVNRRLYAFGIGVWEGLKWLVIKVGSFFGWLFSLFPELERKTIPSIPPEEVIMPTEAVEETFLSLPYMWIIGGVAIVVIVVAIWYFTKIMAGRKLPKTMKPNIIIITEESWWNNFKRKITAYLLELKLRWCMSFSYYYHHPIYWYYHQVLKWGKKNGLQKTKSETSQEYVRRIIAQLPEKEKDFSYGGENYHLPELLKRLNKDYQATYYGQKVKIYGEAEYKLLISHLRNIHLKVRIL